MIIVPPGTTVTWTNTGQQPHSATSTVSETNPNTLDTGILLNGQSASVTFDKPGTYDYFWREAEVDHIGAGPLG